MDIGDLVPPDKSHHNSDLNNVDVASMLEDMKNKGSNTGMLMVGSTDTSKASCLMIIVTGREMMDKTLWLMGEAVKQGLLPITPTKPSDGSITITE